MPAMASLYFIICLVLPVLLCTNPNWSLTYLSYSVIWINGLSLVPIVFFLIRRQKLQWSVCLNYSLIKISKHLHYSVFLIFASLLCPTKPHCIQYIQSIKKLKIWFWDNRTFDTIIKYYFMQRLFLTFSYNLCVIFRNCGIVVCEGLHEDLFLLSYILYDM